MENSRLLVLVSRIARNRRENIFSYHIYFSQCFTWYLKKKQYPSVLSLFQNIFCSANIAVINSVRINALAYYMIELLLILFGSMLSLLYD
jgi:hypothetical protein